MILIGLALIGPSAIHWGNGSGEYGRAAFITTDGGTASPPKGGPQPAKLVRIELSTESELTDRLTPATGAEIGTSPAGRGGTGYQPRHDPHRGTVEPC